MEFSLTERLDAPLLTVTFPCGTDPSTVNELSAFQVGVVDLLVYILHEDPFALCPAPQPLLTCLGGLLLPSRK